MRKLLFFTIITLFAVTLKAQNITTYLSESFNSSSMPAGWSVMGLGAGNWSISSSSHAGGSPRELKLFGEPQFVGISRFVSPAVDLTGVASVEFSFKHYLDNFMDPHTIGIATSSDNGTTWHDAWTEVYEEDGQFTVNLTVTTEDMGNANVRFCIFFTGDVYYVDNWYFDDITVFNMNDLEAELSQINVDDNIALGETSVSFDVHNYGNTEISSIEASYQFENHDVITETFATSIASLNTETFEFSVPTYLIPNAYNLTVNILKVNGIDDSDPSNNTLSKNVHVSYGTAQKIPMIEHFSSSTCNPCVQVNEEMAVLTENNPGKYTYIKYPTNWPGSGDPYNTDECNVRVSYYNVSGVPDLFLDGVTTNHYSVSQTALDQHFNTPALCEIKGSFMTDGNNISIIIDAMSYVDIENVKLYVSVNEKTTTGNTGSNGETEFHHVMLKMFPNASGNDLSFNAGENKRLEFTYDMSSTHVEEMSDLEVSAWLQNYGTKEVLNSRFLYENAPHPYPVENLLLVENETNTMTASWDAPQNGNATGYNVFVNSELAAENIDDLSYTFEYQSDTYNIVEVCAVYENDMTSVKAVTGLFNYLNVNKIEETPSYKIFPNPANSFLKVVAQDKIQTISIFNCIGTLIERINVNASEIEIDTEKYGKGVYFVNIIEKNGSIGTKKLIIAH